MDNPQSKQRTELQNNSLHLWCSQVADALNSSGLDLRKTLKQDFEIPWSPTLIKEILWRETQKIALGKRSTTELTTAEVTKVYDVLNRYLAKHGVHVEWPHDI